MLAEAGAPELQRRDVPAELLQPLVPRYEEALSQLESAIKVGPLPSRGPEGAQRPARGGGRPWRPGLHSAGGGPPRGADQLGAALSPFPLPQEEQRQKAA